MEKLLEIKNIYASIEDKEILKGLNLVINKGETHVIMGPNGAGKSTLGNIILNNTLYTKSKGSIIFNNEEITNLETNKIAKKGIFMSFQNPIEIPGISTINFMKYAKSKIEETSISRLEFNESINESIQHINMKEELLNRELNVGFSGGEKKKNEILQMLMLNPKLAILDETDSGLDFDAIKCVNKGIKEFKNKDNSLLIISHNLNMFKSLHIDYVHILLNGKIIKTGDKSLLELIENKGYEYFKGEVDCNV